MAVGQYASRIADHMISLQAKHHCELSGNGALGAIKARSGTWRPLKPYTLPRCSPIRPQPERRRSSAPSQCATVDVLPLNSQDANVDAAGLRQFGAGQSEMLENAFKVETVGLVTKAEFLSKRNTLRDRLEEEQKRSRRAATEAAHQVPFASYALPPPPLLRNTHLSPATILLKLQCRSLNLDLQVLKA